MAEKLNTDTKQGKGLKKWFGSYLEDFSVMRRFLKIAKQLAPSCTWMMIGMAFFESVTPLIMVIVPKLVLDELLGSQRVPYLVILVATAVLLNFIFSFITALLQRKMEGTCLEIQEKFRVYLGNRIMYRDYEDLEDPDLLDTKNKAVLPLLEGGIWGFYGCITHVITSLVTMAGLITLIATLNATIILLVLVMVAVNSVFYKKSRSIQLEAEQQISVIGRERDYYEKLTGDFTVGKDIRLYSMRSLILDKMLHLQTKMNGFNNGIMRKSAFLDGTTSASSQIQVVLVYLYLIYEVFTGVLGLSAFTMYATAASTFSSTLMNFFYSIMRCQQIIQRAKPFVEFVDIHPKKSNEGKTAKGIRHCEIEFKNVTFRYPRSENDILKNVSVTIHQGEKLSIVGLNGAGKTTFIKLLTRLYDPTEGQILLNGVDIREYGYDEYLTLLAVVFQDFKTFSLSVRENVALADSETARDEEVMSALARAGLEDTVKALPRGLDTTIYKAFDEEGIELSGGQNQKLAIARAIYKNAPIIVLDEPTAALDPISEFEIYSHFNELVEDKTAIYISHRLSSCRFCDRIILFENGRISQSGSHNLLMEDKEGCYYKLYSTQSQHYTD